MSNPTQISVAQSSESPKASPLLDVLAFALFLNWFVFFGISMYIGGDSLGTLPSRDGFIVTSHGHHKAVAESVWLFSLCYSGTTLLLTPLVWLSLAARQSGGQLRQARWKTRLLVCGFILVWVVGWYSSTINSIRRSVEDWQTLKRPNHMSGVAHAQ